MCFKASLKVLLKTTAGALLQLRLIFESCVSIHSAAPLSSITSTTNEASAPPPHLPSSLPLSLPPAHTRPPSTPFYHSCCIGPGPECRSRRWINENAAGPKGRVERVEDREWQRHRQRKRKRDGEEVWWGRRTAMHWMSHRLVLLIASSLSSTNLACPLCQQ